MPTFMDFHDDLKLPGEAIEQITQDTKDEKADEFGVRQVELFHNSDGKVYCLLEAPDAMRCASTTRRSVSRAATYTRSPGSSRRGPDRPIGEQQACRTRCEVGTVTEVEALFAAVPVSDPVSGRSSWFSPIVRPARRTWSSTTTR